MKKFGLLFLIAGSLSFAQSWNYNFGTGTGTYSTASGVSLTFLPDPPTGGGADSRVRIGTTGGSFNLENQTISFGGQSYLRVVAPTSASVNKFSIYDYTAGKSYTIQFTVRFGASDGSSSGAASGEWYFFAGDGAIYSSSTGFSGAEVFTGIQWIFGGSGSITTNVRVGSGWTLITGTPFSQGNTYTVDIYGNNTTALASYTYGSSQSVAANTMDIWVNGTLVANDIGKALLPNDANIDSYMFYGESSTGNVANIFLDDIIHTNTIALVPLPVELTSISATTLGSTVKLNWATETEVNNYGFEILRQAQDDKEWTKIGFVNGNGNSNSPKSYSYEDKNVSAGKYSYRLKQIDNNGQFEYSKTIEVDLGAPTKFELSQNYPNPFNPATTISYNLPEASNVKLTIFNLLGQEIKTLVNEFKEAGVHRVNFDASELNSGLYIYKLQAGSQVQTRKMTLVK